MTDQIPTTAPPTASAPLTDDPAVLRELLRQATDRLAAIASLETMLNDHHARTQAMLEASTTAARVPDPGILPAAAAAIDRVRSSMSASLDELDALRALLAPEPPRADDPAPEPIASSASIDPAVPAGTTRTDVVIHGVATPALARAIQRHLAATPGVDRADVRELVDGLLRVTVTGTGPIGANALFGWKPDRPREVRAEAPGVLEIELLPAP